ncbi:MAG: TonB family protein [Thermodesulfobacteriota bacterium]
MRTIAPLDYPSIDEEPTGPDPCEGEFPDVDVENHEDDETTTLDAQVRPLATGDRALKFGIVASVVLHAFFVCAMPRVFNFGSQAEERRSKAEEVAKVRLVEFTTPPKENEQVPDKASALSDRDHVAERERIPLRPPGKQPDRDTPQEEVKVASLQPAPVPKETSKTDDKKPAKARKPDKKHEHAKIDKDRTPDPKKNLEARIHPDPSSKADVDLRPSMEDIRKGLLGEPGSSDFFPEGDMEEAVVDMNTRHERFFSYLMHLKQKIEAVWVYPKNASRSGVGGNLTVEFAVGKDGTLIGVNLLDSSGNEILDQAAMSAIRVAAPYHPFPPRIKTQRLRIRAKFIYVTNSYFQKVM